MPLGRRRGSLPRPRRAVRPARPRRTCATCGWSRASAPRPASGWPARGAWRSSTTSSTPRCAASWHADPTVARIASRFDPSTAEARENRERVAALCDELAARVARAQAGGGERAVARHRERGKLLARERIDRLVDPETAFLELSPLAGDGVYEDETPSAGIVTGVGRIAGRTCVIVANDATVKGGTYYPL